MAISGNKGEWSEIYTLFKLLGDGVVYAGNGNMEKIDTLFYPILRVIRQEEKNYQYAPKVEDGRRFSVSQWLVFPKPQEGYYAIFRKQEALRSPFPPLKSLWLL